MLASGSNTQYSAMIFHATKRYSRILTIIRYCTYLILGRIANSLAYRTRNNLEIGIDFYISRYDVNNNKRGLICF